MSMMALRVHCRFIKSEPTSSNSRGRSGSGGWPHRHGPIFPRALACASRSRSQQLSMVNDEAPQSPAFPRPRRSSARLVFVSWCQGAPASALALSSGFAPHYRRDGGRWLERLNRPLSPNVGIRSGDRGRAAQSKSRPPVPRARTQRSNWKSYTAKYLLQFQSPVQRPWSLVVGACSLESGGGGAALATATACAAHYIAPPTVFN